MKVSTWDMTLTWKVLLEFQEPESHVTTFTRISAAEERMLGKLAKYKDKFESFQGGFEATVGSETLFFRNFRTGPDEESFKFDVRYA